MSAYIIDQKNIAKIVSTARAYKQGYSNSLTVIDDGALISYNLNDTDDLTKIGQILTDANYESVNYRYKENTEPEIFKFHYNGAYFKEPVKLLKALHSYEYQSCEHPGWHDSIAYQIAARLERMAINHLPGYDEAEWI